jgi:predicted dehydrogenase
MRPERAGRIRAAVIGAGAWARACHLPVLRAHPDVDIVAVCDVDAQRAADAATEFDVPLALTDWHAVLDRQLDVCIVASPAAAHYEQASAALTAGAHVLIEKPMVLRAAEAQDLIDRAVAGGRHLVVAFGWNYSQLYANARQLFADPGVGRVEHVSVHMASGTRDLLLGTSRSSTGSDTDLAVSATWTDPAISGGGYGQAQLPHALGVTLGIIEQQVVAAHAVASRPSGGPVETCLAISGRLDSGASIAISGASFHAGLTENRHQLEIRVFGSAGNLLVDFGRDELRLERPEGSFTTALEAGAGRYDGSGPAAALIELARGAPSENLSDGSIGLRTVQALELAYGSMSIGSPID